MLTFFTLVIQHIIIFIETSVTRYILLFLCREVYVSEIDLLI